MRNMTAMRWLLTAGALVLSSLASAQVRISEIHYDNTSTDTGEAIEVSAPAGTDLTGWSIVLYNGTGGVTYDTDALSGVVPAVCDTRGVVVLNYPSNGIQNGAPDGIALVNAGGTVVEFISYEGPLTATNGPANGQTAVDIGALQNGNGPIGESLQRNADGVWSLAPSTFGACNDNGGSTPTPVVASITVVPASITIPVGGSVTLTATAFDAGGQPIANVPFTWSSGGTEVATVNASGVVTGAGLGSTAIWARSANDIVGTAVVNVEEISVPEGDFRISEIHYDNAGTDANEAIEIEGTAFADITGFTLVLYNGSNGQPYSTRTLSGVLGETCEATGVLVTNYPVDGIQNGPDAIALVDNAGRVIEFLAYEGTFVATAGPAAGMTPVDIGASQTNAPTGFSLQRNTLNVWNAGVNTFGACNPEAPDPGANTIQFSGRTPGDVPLPVGFEDQLFARLVNGLNQTVPSTFTWEALTPEIATIDANGVIHALAAGSATFRATAAADGTTDTWTLPTHVAVASATANYANNTEFGEPQDSDPTDDFIIERPQYTSSWNPNRGSPNWVSYEIDASHFGAEDRCDCFTMDVELPASLPRLTTADYTDAGAFHGYGIDRGHLARSFDRTAGSLDNATTYYFSNIIAQAADNNQGPWAQFENHLGDLARVQGLEVYVIAGARSPR